VLHAFTGGTDGSAPAGGVLRDSSGNLYGATKSGGTANAGIVYKLDASGNETIVYTFTGAADGGQPMGNVTRDSAGNLYGTTLCGAPCATGLVYKIDTAGHETVLYSFSNGSDGGNPDAGVIRDAAGNLYGTTEFGGSQNLGTVFKLDSTGRETVLYSFAGTGDGILPFGGVTGDAAGNLYGTASGGGASGNGAVYRLDASGHETILYSFTSGFNGYPTSGAVLDPAGNLYGTTLDDGGTAYRIDASGHGTVLHTFAGAGDGFNNYGGVALDSAGNLYGTTYYGGNILGEPGQGIVYKLDSTGNETILYVFTGRNGDGENPYAGVVLDAAGNLYGTTYQGGGGGAGTVYKLDTSGRETVLYTFSYSGTTGAYPYAGVILDAAGNLYGATTQGGSGNCGVVYMVDVTGHETVLHSFAGGTDGCSPYAGVIRDPAGNLYGTTRYGGGADKGVIFMLDAIGNETVLHSFTGGTDGEFPYTASLFRDSVGNLYGTTPYGGKWSAGVVFKLKLQ
jgi:uncharacterized repeat protein (TIGR03803 family)